MKKWILLATFCALLLLGVRVYGAFETEHDDAIGRAKAADAEAAKDLSEYNRISAQNECNLRWLEYKNAEVKNQIADLEGRRKQYVASPSCDGYAESLGSSFQTGIEALNRMFASLDARTYAVLEWKYAENRRLQARYLASKIWAATKGTKLPQLYQSQLEQDWENRHSGRKLPAQR